MSSELKATEIVTPPLRLAFPALFEPKPVAKGNPDLKYQAAVLLPPDTDLKPFHACIKAAMEDKWGKVIKLPARSNPIKSCDEKDLGGYDEGWHFINTKSGYQPSVVDQRRQEILDATKVYSGCWCRFHLKCYAWEHPQGGKGISFSLNAVQFVRDDERLDGRRNVEDVFEPIEVEGDEEREEEEDLDALFD